MRTIEELKDKILDILYSTVDVNTAINHVIAMSGRYFNVSRVYIFENSDDDLFCTNTYEWCNDGITPEIDHLQRLSYLEDLGGVWTDNYDSDGLFFCPSIQALPPMQRKILEPQGITSMLQCAIKEQGVFKGYIGFDNCDGNSAGWETSQEAIDALVYTSRLLTIYLLEQRNRARLIENVKLQMEAEERKRRELTDALTMTREAIKAKSVFLSNMSHDLRTPMNAIIGMVDLALENEADQEQVHESLTIVKNSSEHLLALINDVLNMSRIESGRETKQESSFSQQEILSVVYGATSVLARNKQQKFRIEKDIRHDRCIGDAQHLNRILTNLLGNAVKFTPPQGEILFKAEEFPSKGTNMRLFRYTISDNGIGMDEETQKHIFETFYRAAAPEISQIEGTGLGLSIVKSLVELIGGTIRLKSSLNEGSTFIVEVPMRINLAASRNEGLLDQIAEVYDYDLSSVHILLAEDNLVNQKVAVRILERAGATVEIAENGEVAVKRFCSSDDQPFEIILMDIQMPVMDGYEAARRIRESGREDAERIPIIAMTANAFQEDIRKCLDSGMNGHIAKPIHPNELYSVICKCTSGCVNRIKKKILVVDDMEVNALAVAIPLEEQFEVLTACDGRHALELLEENLDIIAVITDIQMPNMNGMDLIKAIRANASYESIAILANTQYGDSNQEEALLAAGADDFLYKPTTPFIVTTRLKNVLLRYRRV